MYVYLSIATYPLDLAKTRLQIQGEQLATASNGNGQVSMWGIVSEKWNQTNGTG